MLTLSAGLLEKVDALAHKNYTSRSAIVRWALADYVNSQPMAPAQPAQSLSTDKTEQQNGDQHPDDVRFDKFMAAIYELEEKT